MKYCGGCGAVLDSSSEPAQEAVVRPAEVHGERRQLTVMFCDLVGSTALSEQLDPEDLRGVMRSYQDACAQAIEYYDGHIAQTLGDGLMVYFGYPTAHEDDALRSVRAGLEIIDRVCAIRALAQLAVRIGIHTGSVVVGEMGGADTRGDMAVVGETPNLAARLQAIADPNTLVIGPLTYRLIEELFDCENLGPREVKGISQPVVVWQVKGERPAETRFEASHRASLTPLVGREQEIALLTHRWQLAKDGEGQVVLLSGEAGIGKSRLFYDLRDRIADEPHLQIRLQCSSNHTNSAYFPFIRYYEHAAGFGCDDTLDEKLDKLETLLAQPTDHVAEVAPLFAAMLSIPTKGRYPSLNLSLLRQKEKTFGAIVEQLLGLARKTSVLILFEDVHWIDPTSLETLDHLIDSIENARMLVVISFRPEFTPMWYGPSQITQLPLNRLSRRQGVTMVQEVAGGKALPSEVMDKIVVKTDGVPLFVEELTKAVIESGLVQDKGDRFELTGPLPPLAIPATLQDSLIARLDHLSSVRETAQIGAAIGREFSYDLLVAVSPLGEHRLREALAHLVDSELVFCRGVPPEAVYSFKHGLIQDAAYESLLKSKRQELHSRIARVLKERFPQLIENEPEILAHHCTAAGLVDSAVGYWLRASQRAAERWANLEAIAHLRKGMELLASQPESRERKQQELLLQTALGPILMATKGEAVREVAETYGRARDLCEQLGDHQQLYPALQGLWICHLERAELGAARDLAEQLFASAQTEKDPALLLEGHRTMGLNMFWQGQLASAHWHLNQGIASYHIERHRSHAFVYGLDPGVHCLSYAAWVQWFLGYPDQALPKCQQALALAKQLSHPFSLAAAHYFAARFHLYRREVHAAREQAEATVRFSAEQGIPEWLAVGTIVHGWTLAALGHGEDAIAEMQRGLEAWVAAEGKLGRTLFLTLLAEAQANQGRTQDGLETLTEALRMATKTGERFYEAELYRLKGELLLQATRDDNRAAKCFHRALKIAGRQEAKSLELRAAISLARLWHVQGRPAEARKLLAPVYNWFSEGFDTSDLKDANALLMELS
ncbi:MAG: AAA family ATPase [Gammaproteobacteria bacterium]|nr:AAA family ATPase [Gammaproteobacteria bacterium]